MSALGDHLRAISSETVRPSAGYGKEKGGVSPDEV